MYLGAEKIKKKIKEEKLVENYIHLDTQLKENNFDLTVSSISEIKGKGEVDFSDKERHIPKANPVQPRKKNPEDKYGWWMLPKGNYVAKTNEKLNIPKGTIAILQPRLSLLQSGLNIPLRIITQTKGTEVHFNLAVTTHNGFEIKENARIISTTFIEPKGNKGYGGY